MCTLGGCGHAADLAKFLVKIKQSGKKTIFLFLRERKNEKILKDQLLVLKSDQKNYYFVWKERERDRNNQIKKTGRLPAVIRRASSTPGAIKNRADLEGTKMTEKVKSRTATLALNSKGRRKGVGLTRQTMANPAPATSPQRNPSVCSNRGLLFCVR